MKDRKKEIEGERNKEKEGDKEKIKTTLFNLKYYFMNMGILPAYMSMHHMCAWCLHTTEDGLRPLELK